MKRITRISVVMLAFAFVQPASAAQSARDHWKKGTDYAKVHLYIEALEQFSAAIRVNKGELSVAEVAQVFGERGAVYRQQKRYDESVSDLSNALRLDERSAELYNQRGIVFLETGDIGSARQDFMKAISIDPQNTAYLQSKARLEMEDKNYPQAVRDLSALLAVAPDSVSALYSRGVAYKVLEKYDQALGDFSKMIEIDPKASLALYQKAAIFSRQGKVDVACVILEEAVRLGYRDRKSITDSSDFDRIRKSDCYLSVIRGL